jgi:hypothetical protein
MFVIPAIVAGSPLAVICLSNGMSGFPFLKLPGVVLLKETVVGTEPPGTDDVRLTDCPAQIAVWEVAAVTTGAILTLTDLMAVVTQDPFDTE